MWHKKTGTFEKPNKNWRNSRKKFIDRNWTITACLLRDSNPNYQCLKITSCRWRPPPRMHSFTATMHFKSSHSFVSPCVCCMLCRMRLCHILQSMQHIQSDSCNGSISVNTFFFLDFFNFCWVFQKFPFFCVTLCVCVYIYIYIYIYIFQKLVNLHVSHRGFAVVQLVEAKVYKPQGQKFDSWW